MTTDPPTPDAQSVYEEFLRRRKLGESVDLEEYCRQHPRLAIALRGLHSIDVDSRRDTEDGDAERRADSISTTASFVERVARLPAGSALSTPVPLAVGQTVGEYRLVEVIGQGGFATVFRAEQERPVRRTVALKSIRPQLGSSEVLQRFEAERQALAKMGHTSIARVYDAGTTESGQPFLVMELVDGLAITDHCDAENLGLRDRLRLFIKICDAIHHAHQRAIVHRDLKPSNVLVAREGSEAIPKVIDFGIAKAIQEPLTDVPLVTEVGQIIGTPEYMSPEQVDTSIGGIDTRTDTYALGVLLYELVTGARPFASDELRAVGLPEMVRTIREVEPPRPSVRFAGLDAESRREIAASRSTDTRVLAQSIRGDLDWIVLRAIAKDPNERYESVASLARDVQLHLEDRPVEAGPPAMAYRLRKLARRRRGLLIGAAVLVVATTLVALVATQLKERRSRANDATRSDEILSEGKARWDAARETSYQLALERAEWQRQRERPPSFRPVWDRRDELDSWAGLRRLTATRDQQQSECLLHFIEAYHKAPAGSPEKSRAQVSLLEFDRSIELASGETLTALIVERTLAGTVTEPSELEELAPGANSLTRTIRLHSTPAGARVYVFRYEEVDARLLPLAIDPRQPDAPTGQPFLEIESIVDTERARGLQADASVLQFSPGDRWQTIGGEAIRSRAALARVVESLEAGRAVDLRFLREGRPIECSWTPFSESLAAGAKRKLLNIRDQLGFTFAGYPIDRNERNSIGRTRASGGPDWIARAGSYLLVFQREGLPDVRYPMLVDADTPGEVHIELPGRGPEGFVFVATGTSRIGGDERAEQALPPQSVEVDGFWMARHEVTFRQYLEFLDAYDAEHPEARGETIRGAGDAQTTEHDLFLVGPAAIRQAPARLSLLPYNNSDRPSPLVEREDSGKWVQKAAVRHLDWPVIGVSYLATQAYIEWRTQRDADGWVYRLPSDLEWERAGRGADGRVYPWGDYLVWSFAVSYYGNHRQFKLPWRVGSRPEDESVFGVRDLSGSAEELTSDHTVGNFSVRRGGSWDRVDEQFFRLASRNGLLPTVRTRQVGIRLACDARPTNSDSQRR